jgi:hypothetical protein
MGRAFFIKHRTSHLTIGVTDEIVERRGSRQSRGERRAAAAARRPSGRARTAPSTTAARGKS